MLVKRATRIQVNFISCFNFLLSNARNTITSAWSPCSTKSQGVLIWDSMTPMWRHCDSVPHLYERNDGHDACSRLPLYACQKAGLFVRRGQCPSQGETEHHVEHGELRQHVKHCTHKSSVEVNKFKWTAWNHFLNDTHIWQTPMTKFVEKLLKYQTLWLSYFMWN